MVSLSNIFEIAIGQKMPDGTMYAGISPDTQKPFFALPSDLKNGLRMSWYEAVFRASELKTENHIAGTFRLPSEKELNLMLRNGNEIGGFYQTREPFTHKTYPDTGIRRTYWSSTRDWEESAITVGINPPPNDIEAGYIYKWHDRLNENFHVRLVRD